jgi:hypothetical protein
MRLYDLPIQMSAPMVLGLLREVRREPGGKTVTRRAPAAKWSKAEKMMAEGVPTRFWVQEAVACGACAPSKPSEWSANFWRRYQGSPENPTGLWYRADGLEPAAIISPRGKWNPAMFMPRWVSRLTLLDVSIRRERLGDISEEDARAEGIVPYQGPMRWVRWLDAVTGNAEHNSACEAYIALWNHLHGPNAWERNADKEVMVISFRPVAENIDRLKVAA